MSVVLSTSGSTLRLGQMHAVPPKSTIKCSQPVNLTHCRGIEGHLPQQSGNLGDRKKNQAAGRGCVNRSV
jgi:hypothetical protein